MINSYEELENHIGHNIVCVSYGDSEEIWNVAIECKDCQEVLLDFDQVSE